MAKRARTPKSVETLTHGDATRKNIPTAEYQPVMREEEQTPIRVAYQRRNRDLDPQLVWRGSACRTSPCATSPTTRKSTSFGTNARTASGIAQRGSRRDMAEWEIPREADAAWSDEAKALHGQWWEQRIARQKEIDASIAAKADYEYLYDKPYEDKKKVRVAGPFTVDSLSPHRVLGVDENDDLIDSATMRGDSESQDFAEMIMEHLKTAGVQQARKDDRIAFSSLAPWPGDLVCAEGTYAEGDSDSGIYKRAGIFIGPEFGTVSRPDLVRAVARGGRSRFRCAHLLRVQLRRPIHGVRQTGARFGAQSAHERGSPHGRRSQEHRQGQFVRDFRGAGYRHSRRRRRSNPSQGQWRGCLPSQHRRDSQRRRRRHRLLVHRHGLQRGEFFSCATPTSSA